MREKAKVINNKIIDTMIKLMNEKNITQEEFISEIINNTIMTESRIRRILDRTSKMAITIKELYYISLVLNVDIKELLKDVDKVLDLH